MIVKNLTRVYPTAKPVCLTAVLHRIPVLLEGGPRGPLLQLPSGLQPPRNHGERRAVISEAAAQRPSGFGMSHPLWFSIPSFVGERH